MIQVLIVEDIPLFRTGLRHALQQMSDCEIVGEATHPGDILQVARTRKPDVVLLNQNLATAPALEIARFLYQQQQRGVFVLADPPSEEQLFEFQLVGAAAYEGRWIAPTDLAQKIQRVSTGEYLCSGDSLEIPRKEPQETLELSTGSDCPLTPREAQVLVFIAQGMSNKQIARALSVGEWTVRNHITGILATLGVRDRTAAVVEAWRQNWMLPDGSANGQKREAGRARERGSDRLSRRTVLPDQEEASLNQSPPASEIHYHLQRSFCHKPACRLCQQGCGHGPYWYAYQTIGGRRIRRYVGKTLPAPALSAPPANGCE